MNVVTVEEMRRLEEPVEASGTSSRALMERAGLAVGAAARDRLGGCAGRSVVVLIGPGNNGGDGFIAARHLARWGASVTGFVPVDRREPDDLEVTAREYGCTVFAAGSDPDRTALVERVSGADLVIDALLGTGHGRPLKGPIASVLSTIRGMRTPVLAVDLPTGVDADTGAVDAETVPADLTVVLGAPKRGMFEPGAAEVCGRWVFADIGIGAGRGDGGIELIDSALVRRVLPGRPLHGHKGTFGRATIFGGSSNYVGAPALAGRGAGRVGAGVVTLATPAPVSAQAASMMPEATHFSWEGFGDPGDVGKNESPTVSQLARESAAIVLGPGLGLGAAARGLIERFVQTPNSADYPPVVVDADALTILAERDEWYRVFPGPAVVTPHPGEMARLTGVSASEIQANRVETARSSAGRWGLTVVLKGAFTVVADSDGRTAISPWASPVLGTAGTGDVLAGAIAGLLAQGSAPFEAACAGVYLHGSAAALAAVDHGDPETGVLAGDVAEHLPAAIGIVRRGGRVDGAFA